MPTLLQRLRPLGGCYSHIPSSIGRRSRNPLFPPSPAPTAPPSRPSSFSASPALFKNTNLPPRPKPPPEDEIEESFLKGSGPGGQKINKTNSAVQLKHLPTGIVVKSQATRSRTQNRAIARQLLADKLDQLARGDESRAAVVGEFHRKKKASSAKKSRRKYRKLEKEKEEEKEKEKEEEMEDYFDIYPDSARLREIKERRLRREREIDHRSK
ncbi:RF-1 domain-containing protein [Daldinia caldariorum]|uniref:RF-1 domain-containing protein n=1 Tax=Daldinia caldariorum TaxID=326644 RepID=UPI002007D8D8|nr:RF-1 domain-containing protein [Daldinia caldariorum]KAI1463677.1 RF-1 domain-containing protein [Daldinia caldariorum]